MDLVKDCNDIQLFLQQPLWKHSFPNELTSVFERFQKWVNHLGSGFEFWLDWYQQRLNGKALNLVLLEKQVNIPDDIKNQGVKVTNMYLARLNDTHKKANETLLSLKNIRSIDSESCIAA